MHHCILTLETGSLVLTSMENTCRGSTIASHMSPNTARLVWAFCWALGLFQRTAARPPVAMFQDLQVPSHAGSRNDRAAFPLPGGMVGSVGMRLIIVAAEQSVLCLGCWPRAGSRLEDTAGDAFFLRQAPELESLVRHRTLCACLCTYVGLFPGCHCCGVAMLIFSVSFQF